MPLHAVDRLTLPSFGDFVSLLPFFLPSRFVALAVGGSRADGILPLRASAFLLLATLCAVLGVRAFPRLPLFFPRMLQALDSQTTAEVSGGGGQSLLWTSALSAVATVAASLPSFLSPYLGRILAVALGSFPAVATGSKQAADRVLSLLAAGVEPRLLVPAVCGAYPGCVENAKVDDPTAHVVAASRSVARLLTYVQEVKYEYRVLVECETSAKRGVLGYVKIVRCDDREQS